MLKAAIAKLAYWSGSQQSLRDVSCAVAEHAQVLRPEVNGRPVLVGLVARVGDVASTPVLNFPRKASRT